MNRQKSILIINILITVLFIAGYCQEAFAAPSGSFTTQLPIMVSPMPEFETRWKAEAVIDSFEEKGLAVAKQKSVFNALAKGSSANIEEEAVSFDIPSLGKDVGGSINTFKYKIELEELQRHFLDLNKKGDFHTWSYAKDNVLIILTGNVPENIARQYEKALVSLKK